MSLTHFTHSLNFHENDMKNMTPEHMSIPADSNFM